VDIVKARVGYRRPYAVQRALNGWFNGGYAERYTRHFRAIHYHTGRERRKLGPKRKRVTAAFPMVLWDSGEILPYPGHYEVWRVKIPRWYAKIARRKAERRAKRIFSGDIVNYWEVEERYIYIEK